MLIEEFKNCIHADMKTHLDERKVQTLAEAAKLTDEYALTHKNFFSQKSKSTDNAKPNYGGKSGPSNFNDKAGSPFPCRYWV